MQLLFPYGSINALIRKALIIAIGLVLAGCLPAGPPTATPRSAPSAALAASSVATPGSKAPSIALLDTTHSPFPTAVPPTLVSSGGRLHLFSYNAGSPPALRYTTLDAAGAAPASSSVLPGTTVVSAAACDRGVSAIVRAGSNHVVVSIDERGAITSTYPVALPDRPWAAFALACASERLWILGLTSDTDSSLLWTAALKAGQLDAATDTPLAERSSRLSVTVLAGDVVALRSHGDQGDASLMRLRAGRVIQTVPLHDSVLGAGSVTHVGDQLAVAWTESASVRLRLYSAAFEPSGPVHRLATAAAPELLGALFMLPGPGSTLAVSYFTTRLTDDMIELPDGRTEPAIQIAQYVVAFDAARGAATNSLPLPMAGGLGGGGWAGDRLLFVVGRFSGVVARYQVQ